MFHYRLLTFLFSPLLFSYILWLAIKHQSIRYLQQRLGFKYKSLPAHALWFHCASVGEVNTLLPLIKNIHQTKPELNIIISTNTVTGGKIVKLQNLDYLHHCYLPFDWSNCIQRFLSSVKPLSLHVMETEIWPNLYSICKKYSIPVSIINARLSSKTTSAKPWILSILKASLVNVDAIYARTSQDADAYLQLGADSSKVSVAGNLKLSTALVNQEASELFSTDREFVILASSHKNEESEVAKIWKSLNRKELLIIAARHPERTTAIIKQLDCNNIAIRSKNEVITENTEVYFLDTVGELKNYFSNARLVIMGGSFEAIGGHNILEPASYNSAIITGPYMENFSEEMNLMLKNNAICQVQSYPELKDALIRLLDDEASRNQLQKNTAALTHDVADMMRRYNCLITKKSSDCC